MLLSVCVSYVLSVFHSWCCVTVHACLFLHLRAEYMSPGGPDNDVASTVTPSRFLHLDVLTCPQSFTHGNMQHCSHIQTCITDTVTFTMGDLVSMAIVMFACQRVKTIRDQDWGEWRERIMVSGKNEKKKK